MMRHSVAIKSAQLHNCVLEDHVLDLPAWSHRRITFHDIQRWILLNQVSYHLAPGPWTWQPKEPLKRASKKPGSGRQNLQNHSTCASCFDHTHQSLLLVLGLKLQPWAGKAEPTTCNVFVLCNYVELNYGQSPIDLVKLVLAMLPTSAKNDVCILFSHLFASSCDCISHSGNTSL